MIVGFPDLRAAGWNDSHWVGANGANMGGHPVFAEGFGARITVSDTQPPMAWNGTYLIPPIPIAFESPQEEYLSTAAQDVSLRKPYEAKWWKNTAGVVSSYAEATSEDFTGRHAGPTGQRLDHITISRTSVPAPGGPSCDLDPHALWIGNAHLPRIAEVDPNLTWNLLDDSVVLSTDPHDTTGPTSIEIYVHWVTPIAWVSISGGTYSASLQSVVYVSFDRVQQACQQVGISPDGGVLQYFDGGHNSEGSGGAMPLMGTINPSWESQIVGQWQAPLVSLAADIVADHTVLYDFIPGAGEAG